MSEAVRALGFAAGLVIVLGTGASVFTTLVVPRSSSSRILRSVSRGLAKGVRPILRRLTTHEGRDRLLGVVAPLGMVLVFVTWLVLLVLGFGLMTWWTSGSTLSSAFAVSGSSVFTLGVVSNRAGSSETIEFVASGTGLLVIALEIAYLPTLYSAFSERETEVTLLAARAGVPAWGPEILSRAQRFGTTAELADLYRTWERWAAAVSETHTSYPSLVWLRSPTPRRSWLTSLVAMLDAAALHNAFCPSTSPIQARLFLQMGTQCLRSLGDALRITYDEDPLPTDPIRLQYEEFCEGAESLTSTGFPVERSAEEAWRHFAGWRVNYEAIADQLALLILPAPAPWIAHWDAMGEVRWAKVVNRTPDDPAGAASPTRPDLRTEGA